MMRQPVEPVKATPRRGIGDKRTRHGRGSSARGSTASGALELLREALTVFVQPLDEINEPVLEQS